MSIDKQRIAAVQALEGLGWRWQDGAWRAPETPQGRRSQADAFFWPCPVSLCCGRHQWLRMSGANVPSWGCECGAVTACDPD